MAIIARGRSKCWLCGELLGDDPSAWRAFPAFLPQESRLWRFSDSAVHKACLAKHPDHELLTSLHEEYRGIWESRPKAALGSPEMNRWMETAFAAFRKKAAEI